MRIHFVRPFLILVGVVCSVTANPQGYTHDALTPYNFVSFDEEYLGDGDYLSVYAVTPYDLRDAADHVKNATYGIYRATRKNYQKTFFEEYKNLSPDDIHNVHHAVPKEWLQHGNISWEELHSIENLRGIPKAITETFGKDLHQSTINRHFIVLPGNDTLDALGVRTIGLYDHGYYRDGDDLHQSYAWYTREYGETAVIVVGTNFDHMPDTTSLRAGDTVDISETLLGVSFFSLRIPDDMGGDWGKTRQLNREDEFEVCGGPRECNRI